jgi:biotin transport system substrate-specific component
VESKKPYPAQNKTAVNIQRMAAACIMAAITCVVAPLSVPLPVSEVPVSFTQLVIYFSALILGMKSATLSYLLYLLLGAAGLPVFSGFQGGLHKLAGPTGGYLIAFILLAAVCGFAAQRWPGKRLPFSIAALCGLAIVYAAGTLWYASLTGIPLGATLLTAVVPFLPADIAKIILAVTCGFPLKKILNKAGVLPAA